MPRFARPTRDADAIPHHRACGRRRPPSATLSGTRATGTGSRTLMSRISAAFDVEPPAPFNVSRIACFSIVRHCRAGHDRRDARDRLGYNLGRRSPGARPARPTTARLCAPRHSRARAPCRASRTRAGARSCRGEALYRVSVFSSVAKQEELRERRDVIGTVAERWHLETLSR